MSENYTELFIGIDPGVNTGFAIWHKNGRKFRDIATIKVDVALERLSELNEKYAIKVRFEDARLRKWFGKAGREQLQGAGSIKRDCGIIEDFLKRKDIPYEAVPPKNNKTKLKTDFFKTITGWQGRTSEHARDAAMLVFNK